jgi:hypothetical protein
MRCKAQLPGRTPLLVSSPNLACAQAELERSYQAAVEREHALLERALDAERQALAAQEALAREQGLVAKLRAESSAVVASALKQVGLLAVAGVAARGAFYAPSLWCPGVGGGGLRAQASRSAGVVLGGHAITGWSGGCRAVEGCMLYLSGG